MNNTRELVNYSLNWIVIAPVLMLSTTLYHSLVAGALLVLTILFYCFFCSLIRKFIIYNLRLPALVFLAGTLATILQLSVQAWDYQLATDFGIFLPLIAFNGFLYSLSEEYFLRQNLIQSLKTAAICCLVFMVVICMLGIIRELLVYGTFFKGFSSLEFMINQQYNGLSMFRMAPGALLCAGVILALVKLIDQKVMKFE